MNDIESARRRPAGREAVAVVPRKPPAQIAMPAPARTVVTGRRTGSVVGYFWSRKTKVHVPFESILEYDAITIMEVAGQVGAFAAQPETFHWTDGRGRRRYTPDFLVLPVSDGPIYREVKPRSRLERDPSLGGRRPAIEAACAARGATFEVWTEADIRRQPRLSNVRRILDAGRRVGNRTVESRILRALSDHAGHATMGQLLKGVGDAHLGLTGVLRLAASQAVVVDVEGDLGHATIVRAGGGR